MLQVTGRQQRHVVDPPAAAPAATRRAGWLRLQRTVGNRAVARVVVQRDEVEDLTDDDVDKWYWLPGDRLARLEQRGQGTGQWVFRLEDDVLGESRETLRTGRIDPLPHFATVLGLQNQGDPANWFTRNGEIATARHRVGQTAPTVRQDVGQLLTMTHDELIRIGETHFSDHEMKDWDQTTAVRVNQGVWTDGMGPCITIGATGRRGQTVYNILHHSFAPVSGARLVALGRSIVNEMERMLLEAAGIQRLHLLTDLTFYVVGGNATSVDKMDVMVKLLLFRGHRVGGVADATDEDEGLTTKAFMLLPDGKACWARKLNPPKEPKTDTPPVTFKPLGRGGGGNEFKSPRMLLGRGSGTQDNSKLK